MNGRHLINACHFFMNSKNVWQEYWQQSNAFTSLAADFSGNYDGEIGEHWEQVFESLSESSRVLDIACGNLPVSIIAAQISHKCSLDLNIHACDVVDIDKQHIHTKIGISKSLLDTIQVHSGIKNEDLTDIPINNFDLVTSMFGFEYGDLTKTIISIKNILKPKGRAELICHYDQSQIIQTNRIIVKSILDIKSANGVLTTLMKLSDAMGNLYDRTQILNLKKNVKCERLREKLNAKLLKLYDKYGEQSKDANVVAFVKHFFANLEGSNKVTRNRMIFVYKKELNNHFSRLQDLLNAALTPTKVENMFQICQQYDMHMNQPEEINYNHHQVGLKISILNK